MIKSVGPSQPVFFEKLHKEFCSEILPLPQLGAYNAGEWPST